MEQALRESAAEHRADTDPAEAATQQQPADTASEASDMRSELAAFQEQIQQQLQAQMANMMALFQQQPQPATKPAKQGARAEPAAPATTQQTPSTEEEEVDWVELDGDQLRDDLQGACINDIAPPVRRSIPRCTMTLVVLFLVGLGRDA